MSLSDDLIHLKDENLSPESWYLRTSSILSKTTLRRPLAVGVFQDQSVEEINAIISQCGLDLVQLHGEEQADDIDKISVPCVKVIHVPLEMTGAESLVENIQDKIVSFAGRAIAIILDTSIRGDRSGGTGITFDWKLAENVDFPVILAGGLTPENAVDALKVKGIVGLDVSSGVEFPGKPGIKDHQRIESFISKRKREQ